MYSKNYQPAKHLLFLHTFNFLIFLFISFNSTFAQNEANIWALGDYQLDFNSGEPIVKFEFADYLNRGMGVICDKDGSLLFYTDGFSAWNKNHQLMPNGGGLIPSTIGFRAQESIIIKKPGEEDLYYIFTVDPYNSNETSGLYYSQVNMSLQDGFGDVTTKNVRLLEKTTNKISATFHKNGEDVWLLTHQHNTNSYYVFLITSSGISDGSEYQIGKIHSSIDGQLKFSPDGKKVGVSHEYNFISYTSNENTVLNLFDFNNETGSLSNSMSFNLPADSRGAEGLEFSPSGKKLYVIQGGSSGESGLYQFDLTNPCFEAIKKSKFLLYRENGNKFRQMQLGPDGVIYITKGGGSGGTEHLGTISNTNDIAENVVVEENGLFLDGGDSFVNFTPNFIQNYFYKEDTIDNEIVINEDDCTDTTPPDLSLNGDFIFEVTDYDQCSQSGFWDKTVDPWVTAIDYTDGDISDKVTVDYNNGKGISCDTNGSYNVVYTAIDSSGYTAEIYRKVEIDLPRIQPNDKCEDAISLNPVQIGECYLNKVKLYEFQDNDGDLTSSCVDERFEFYDVFYEIKVPESGNLFLKIDNSNYVYAALFNTCDSEELFCERISDDFWIDSLAIGETYVLQLFTQSYEDFSFCLVDPVQNINNECDKALPLNINRGGECESTTITTNLLFDNYTQISSCNSQLARNLFYKFIAPATGKVRVKDLSYTFYDIGLSIYNFSCDGEEIYCNSQIDDSIIGDLIPGNEYILEIFSNSLDDVVFCIDDGAPTQNNTCSNAILVAVLDEDECTDEKLIEVDIFSNNLNISPSCEFGIDKDIFYSFEVPATGQVKIDVSTSRIGCAIYDECNGNSLFCERDDVRGVIAKGLPAGETVIIQFFIDDIYNTWKFRFCISKSTPPVNDVCTNAQLIDIQDKNECSGYNTSINFEIANFDQKPSCTSRQNDDVYFKTVVPGNGIINVKTDDEVYLTIYDACFGNELLCNYTLNNYVNNIVKNLPSNKEILLQFSKYYDNNNIFFCIEEASESENNLCKNPQLIPVNIAGECNYISANNIANDPSVNPSCESNITADLFYQFVVPASGQVKINGENFGAAIYNSCMANTIYCNNDIDDKDDIVYNLTPSDTLLLQLFQKTKTTEFEFCLEDAPASINNMCDLASPISILPVDSCIEANFTKAPIINNTLNINPVCAANLVADVFYSVVVPENGQIEISKFYTSYNVGLAIYDACYGTNLFCDNDFSYNQVIKNLPPGTEVILQFFQREYKPANFSFCVNDAPFPENDNCTDATQIPVNPQGNCNEYTINADLKFASNDATNSCNGSIKEDVFFKVVVPSSGTIKLNSSDDFYYSIFAVCGGDYITCWEYSNNNVINNLTPNTEVILQIQPDSDKNISFCLEEVFTSVNDLCENAIPLNVVEATACIPLPVDVDNRYNSANTVANCGRNEPDSYYNITVPQSGKLSITASRDDVNIALLESCTGGSIFCGAVDYRGGDLFIDNLIPGEELILQIFQSTYLGEFSICIADPVINNTCENAMLLCNQTTSGTNATAGSQTNISNSWCGYRDYYEVWYQIQPVNSTTIEISTTNCINTSADLNVSLLKGTCGEMIEVACDNIYGINRPITLTIDEVDNNGTYYLYISSDDYDYDDACNFEIKIIEGLELNCCQFEVDLIPWCFPKNTTSGYYVDVVTKDFGLSTGGYIVEGASRINITETGTTTLGPFDNGTTTLTFTGIDDASCIFTKTADFNCTNCAPEIEHSNVNITRSQTFKSAGVIKSNANVTSPDLNYLAKDTIILQPGFSTDTLTDFTIDIIEDCD